MGLKRFVFLAIVFMAAVGYYINGLYSDDFTLIIAGVPVNLPLFMWIVLPIALFALATIFHIIYHGLKEYFVLKGYETDSDNIEYFINDLMIGKVNNLSFKTDEYKKLAKILAQTTIKPKDSFKVKNKTINITANLINTIENGEAIPVKDLRISNSNPLFIKNLWNNLEENSKFAVDILRNSKKYPEDLVKIAFITYLQDANRKDIDKYLKNINIDKEIVNQILKRDRMDLNFVLTNQEVIELIKDVKFSKDDYLKLVQDYKEKLDPDSMVKLAEDLSNSDDNALESYVYILMEYELLDNVRDIIATSGQDELLPYKALLDLKDAGKHYTFDMLCLGGKLELKDDTEDLSLMDIDKEEENSK